MIYLDSSVVLAHILAEDHAPPDSLWGDTLVSSRLLEYEVWNRIHSRNLGSTHGETVRLVLGRLSFLELARPVLARALEPFPLPVRTLDALHLASVDYLYTQGQEPRLASYDQRINDAGRRLGFTLYPL